MSVPGPAPEGAAGPGIPEYVPLSCPCGSREFRLEVPRGKKIARIWCALCKREFGIGFKTC